MKKLLVILMLVFLFSACEICPAAVYQPVYVLKHSSFKALFPPKNDTVEMRIPFSVTDLTSSPNAFRIYVPPGTIRLVVNFYLFNGAKDIGFAVRYQQPPACIYCRCLGNYDQIPWAGKLVRMSDVIQGDVYTENLNGLSKILTFNSSTPLPVDKAGWLYIKKMPFKTSTIRDIVVDIKINTAAYKQWYNNAVWGTDGNPPGISAGNLPVCTLTGGSPDNPVDIQPVIPGHNPLLDLLYPQPQVTGVYETTINEIEIKLILAEQAIVEANDILFKYDYIINDCLIIMTSPDYGELRLLKYEEDLLLVLPDAIILKKIREIGGNK